MPSRLRRNQGSPCVFCDGILNAFDGDKSAQLVSNINLYITVPKILNSRSSLYYI